MALPFSRGRVGELRPRLTGSHVGGGEGAAGEAAHSQSESASPNLSSCLELLPWHVNMLLLSTEHRIQWGLRGSLICKTLEPAIHQRALSPDQHCDDAQHCHQKIIK